MHAVLFTGRSFFFIATAAWVVLSLQTLFQGYQRARYRPKSEYQISVLRVTLDLMT